MKTKVFKCEKCSGQVTDSDLFCQHCGAQFDATVAFSVKKGVAKDLKQGVTALDPKAKFTTFVPVSPSMEGVIITTSSPDEVEKYLKSMKATIVKEKSLAY